MAFSLGSIFVELTCNTAKFLSGMDKASVAAKKTGKDIRAGLGEVGGSLALLGNTGARIGSILESVGDKAAGAFDVAANKGRGFGMLMAGTVLGSVAGLAGGMFALAVRAADVGSKIYEGSEKTGIAASQMSGLMAITKETGGNFEGLTTALARAGVNLEKGIIAPGAGAGKILAQVMGGAKNLSDLGLKPLGDRIQVVLSHIFAMNDTGQRNVALSALLGRGWMENVSSLKLLAEQGYAPAIAQAKRMSMFFDDNAARQAKQFKVALADIEAQFSGMGVAIGQSALPAFSRLMTAMQGMEPNLKALGLRLLAIEGAMTGVGIPLAIKMWKQADAEAGKATQEMTDFLLRVQNLTEGQKANADATGKLTGATKDYRDVLASIVGRQQDELDSLSTLGNKQREAQLEYDRTTREIQKQIDAGGNYAEGVKAMGLAWDIYRAKYVQAMQDSVKIPHIPGVPAMPATSPVLQNYAGMGAVKLGPSALGGSMPGLNATLSRLAAVAGQMDSTRGVMKALREETELSDTSFKRLAAAFPGLTEGEVAATAAGRRMIEQLTKLDQLGTAAEQFTEFKNRLIDEGNDVAGHLIQTLGGAVNEIEGAFAKLAVTGKANFKQIYSGIEESLLKTGMQKGVSSLLGHLGLPGAGGKPDGSSGNPLWVKIAGALHMPGVGAGAPAGGAGGGPVPLPSGVTSIFKSVSKDLGSIGSFFGNIFGGFLAGGGDVSPGHAYMVGEKHAEWFVPHASGRVTPSISTQQMRPLTYAPTYHINTPDADSFKRTQAQLLADGYRTMALTHARNS